MVDNLLLMCGTYLPVQPAVPFSMARVNFVPTEIARLEPLIAKHQRIYFNIHPFPNIPRKRNSGISGRDKDKKLFKGKFKIVSPRSHGEYC